MKLFAISNSKNIIATLRIVTIEKFELTFLLILYFHAFGHTWLLAANKVSFRIEPHCQLHSELVHWSYQDKAIYEKQCKTMYADGT